MLQQDGDFVGWHYRSLDPEDWEVTESLCMKHWTKLSTTLVRCATGRVGAQFRNEVRERLQEPVPACGQGIRRTYQDSRDWVIPPCTGLRFMGVRS